ncbi:MAG: WbqC family protein [bacterium]|nr:WbqC family protein [bacterium]
MSKKLAILQSNYIPWKGYFDLMNSVDEFILYDDVQYTKNDWRNRNRIQTPDGPKWLTIPVSAKGRLSQALKIREVEVSASGAGWNRKHWGTIKQNYAKAKHFRRYSELFEDLYLGSEETNLSRINHRFLTAVCGILGIDTKLTWSMDYELVDGQTERLVDLCRRTGATEYLSGPAARAYMDEDLFAQAGVTLRYMDYAGYPEYDQRCTPFEHAVSVIDLIFNEGPDARRFMKSFG